MKKIFFFLAALTSACMLNAQVYYLMPTATENAPVANVYDVLPWEGDGTPANAEVSPERRAYEWFMNAEFGFGGAGYVTIKDITDGLLNVNTHKVLWINIDRAGFSLGEFDAMFNGDDFKTALSNYVKAGGNLYLTKQATRLVSAIGRASWWPNDYNSNGYFDAHDEWQMCVHFCTDGNIDNPFHASLKYLENGQMQDGLDFITRFPLTSGNDPYRRSDNNCAWGDWNFYFGGAENVPGACEPSRRSTFEETMTCKILGGWGHTRAMDYAGFIEFYPQGAYTGRVMTMGLAAYQWGPQNLSEYNVKNLTKGILEYLTPVTPTAMPTVVEHVAHKSIENGKVVILKNGVRYNVLGTQL